VLLITGIEEASTMDEQQRLREIEKRLEEVAATIVQLMEALQQLRRELEAKKNGERPAD